MLYSIIPPLLIILSLIGIILFLVKKAPQVAMLEEKNFEVKKKTKVKEEKLRKVGVAIMRINKVFKVAKEKIKAILTKKRIDKNEEKRKNDLLEQEKIARKIKETKRNRKKIEKNLEKFFGDKKKKIRPIISEKIVRPRKIEKVMIERIANNPKDVKAYESLGEYYLEVENWEDAKGCFKQVIKLDPRNINVKIKMRKLERIIKH